MSNGLLRSDQSSDPRRSGHSSAPLGVGETIRLLGDWQSRPGGLASSLASAIRAAIEAGLLTSGDRLPAERALAAGLSVSRSTVVKALDELRGEALVTSRQGSGSVVTAPPGPLAPLHRQGQVGRLFVGGDAINLAAAVTADTSWLPDLVVTSADLAAVVPAHGYDSTGPLTLRRLVSENLRNLGIEHRPEEIMVTTGAHQAVSLALETLTRPGDPILVEDPTYPGVHDIVGRLGLRPVPWPRDAAGPTPDGLRRGLAGGIRLAYVAGPVHNPTGTITGRSRCRTLAGLLSGSDCVLVEDSTLNGTRHRGDDAVAPIAALTRGVETVSVGSVSKTGWGGLRVGWLAASLPLVDRIERVRLGRDLGSSMVSALMARRFLSMWPDLADARRMHLRRRQALTAEFVARELSEWDLLPAEAGLASWVRTPLSDTLPLVQLAARYGVHVAPGSATRVGGVADPHLRICFDRPEAVLTEGLRRLKSAWRALTHAEPPVTG
ncbi:MAG TPA: PLP-dependent aminotransferase family protein [Acidimicrobiales bacterium]|nr:PLP-dependent aminotransferase family protein [Acidimicrobiales bacterium]